MPDKDHDKNVDYKKMYFTMVNAMEKAMETMIAAQQECEEMYINAQESEKTTVS